MAGRKVSNAAGAVAVALVAVLVVAAVSGAAGLCGVDEDALETCRSYCTRGSTDAKPSDACCAALGHADFGCFCGYKAMLRAYNLDPNRAMKIPSECGIPGAPRTCK